MELGIWENRGIGGLTNRLRGGGMDFSEALAPPSLTRIRKAARESPIAALLWQSNVSGKDIPDAAAYPAQSTPPPLRLPAICWLFWRVCGRSIVSTCYKNIPGYNA